MLAMSIDCKQKYAVSVGLGVVYPLLLLDSLPSKYVCVGIYVLFSAVV